LLPERKYLYLWNYEKHYWNSNDKSRIYDNREFEESVGKWLHCNSGRQPEIATWPPKPEVLISPEPWHIRSKFQRQIWVFDHAELEDTYLRAIATISTTGNSNIDCLTPILPFPASRRCRNHLITLLWSSLWSKTPIYRWNFDDICHIFGDISTSGLVDHIAISGCPSSSKLLSLKSSCLIFSGSQFKRNKFDVFK